jgi:hypothetical protein
MSDEDRRGEEGRGTERQNETLLKAWNELAAKMLTAGWSMPPASSPPDLGRQLRANYLGAWSEFFESWMRTPEFLDWMRQSLGGGTEVRRQLNEFFSRLQNSFQAVSRQDFDQLMATVRGLEDRVRHDSQEILARLEEIQARLDAGKSGSPDDAARPAEGRARAARGRKPAGRNSPPEQE